MPESKNKNRLTRLVLRITVVLFSLQPCLAQPPVHDPSSMIKNTDGRYWVFTTGNGVSALSAENKKFDNWRVEQSVFPAAYPSWVDSYTTDFGGHFWAPDVIYMNGFYYLYYSASSWGTTKSAIGVARTEKLGTEWTDLGKVIASNGSASDRNAIDPALFKDKNGRVWMSYGSFFAGIGLVEIDTITGKTIGSVTRIAGGNHQDIEAPYITQHDNYYYLFVNRGSCCNGLESTYYMQVARSKNVIGPYTGWKTFLSSEGRFHGPGHVGLGEGTFTYHFYDKESNGAARLSISTISWENGWPVPGIPQAWDAPEGEFIENGEYRIHALHSGMAVEVANNNPNEGANVQQGSVEKENGQIWDLSKVDDNWYKISPKANSNLAFDVYGISSDDGANINLWTYWGGDGQQYKFEEVKAGVYHIIARNSRKCLQVVNASIADRANIVQSRCDDQADHQLFMLKDPDAITGINDLFGAKELFRVYPNPAQDYIAINLPGNYSQDPSITFYDQLGRNVLSYPSIKDHKNQLDITQLKSGRYSVKISTENQTFSQTLIKK